MTDLVYHDEAESRPPRRPYWKGLRDQQEIQQTRNAFQFSQ